MMKSTDSVKGRSIRTPLALIAAMHCVFILVILQATAPMTASAQTTARGEISTSQVTPNPVTMRSFFTIRNVANEAGTIDSLTVNVANTSTRTSHVLTIWVYDQAGRQVGYQPSINRSLPVRANVSVTVPISPQMSVTSGTAFEVRVDGGGGPLTFNITASGTKPVLDEPIPDRCEGQSHTDATGQSIPPGPDWQIPVDGYGRQPARELTPAEQEGDRVYVVSSAPSGQNRYTSQLHYQTTVEGQFVRVGKTTGWIYNALAFNPADNWLYTISQPRYGTEYAVADKVDGRRDTSPREDPCFPAGHLLQIDPATGQVYDLGKVTGEGPDGYGFGGEYATPWPNDLWGGINAGFFDQQGDYWVANASLSGTGALYRVDLDQVTASSPNPSLAYGNDQWDRRMRGDWCAEGPTPTTRTEFNRLWDRGALGCAGASDRNVLGWEYRASAEDYTFAPQFDADHNFIQDPANNYAWGIQNAWASSDSNVYMERINLATGKVRRFNITQLTNSFGDRVPTGHQWGKAWFYGDGTLGFSTTSTGANSQLVQIQINDATTENPTFELVSTNQNAPTGYNSNGTSTTNPFTQREVDLNIEKISTDGRDGDDPARANWTIRVENLGPDTATGFHIQDTFAPDTFSDPQLHQVLVGEGQPAPQYDMTTTSTGFQVSFGTLAAGHWVEVEFSAAPPTREGCYENEATVRGLDYDPTIENNWASDWNCGPTVAKNIVDVNGDGAIDTADTSLPSESGALAARYELVVTGPAEGSPATYSLRDAPQFTGLVEVTGARVVGVSGDGAYSEADQTSFGPPAEGQEWVIVPETAEWTIAQGQTHTYLLEVDYAWSGSTGLDALSEEERATLECRVGPGNGLFNTVYLDYEGQTFEDDACGPVGEEPEPDPGIVTVQKAEYDPSNPTEPTILDELAGAEFVVYGAEESGEIDYQNVIAEIDAGNRAFEVPTAGTFYLVETRSPGGMNLLAEPVRFDATVDPETNEIVVTQSGDSVLVAVSGQGADIVLTVADTSVGVLPDTGGRGIGVYALIGLVLIGMAFGFLSRTRATA